MPVLTGPSGVVANLRVARGFRERRRGLIGSAELRPDEGLLIRRCRQVHTFGVGYPIDVVFVDRAGIVVAVHTLHPRSVSPRARRARDCIELQAGRACACGIDVGTRLEFA